MTRIEASRLTAWGGQTKSPSKEGSVGFVTGPHAAGGPKRKSQNDHRT